MAIASPSSPPEQGQLVNVQQRRYVVTQVAKSTLPASPWRPSDNGAQHLVSLSSVEDDAFGEELQVIWELEPGAQVIEKVALPEPTEMDNDALDRWFKKQDYNTREMVYGLFYINGDNNLENLRLPQQTWKVRLIEEEFKRLMFDVSDV